MDSVLTCDVRDIIGWWCLYVEPVDELQTCTPAAKTSLLQPLFLPVGAMPTHR